MKIKRRLLIWLISAAIGVSGCAGERTQVLDLGEFQIYVTEFERQAASNGMALRVTDLRIGFGPMENHRQRAVCEMKPDSPPTIILDHAAWATMDEMDRESLIFHELGHCVLKRKHVSERTSLGTPNSLMHPALVRGTTYEVERAQYLQELFSIANDL